MGKGEIMIDENEKINVHYYYSYKVEMSVCYEYVGFYYSYEGDDEVRDRYIEVGSEEDICDEVGRDFDLDKKHEISKQHYELLIARDKL